jgi:hypothetical protein
MKPATKPALVHKADGIQVQRGIPIPPKRQGRPDKFPWAVLQINDSFFVPDTKTFAHFYRRTKKLGIKITCRRIGNGVRVWRIA